MNEAEQQVFGVLRFADERELILWEIAKRAGYGIRRTTAAIRELRKEGFVETRRTGHTQGGKSTTYVRLRH